MLSKFRKILTAVKAANENLLYSKEILRAEVFKSTIENSIWLKDKSFSPGAWAMDYGMLYSLYRILNDTKPQRIIEFGLGQSAKMIHQYAHHYKHSYAETVEHDEEWTKFFRQGLNNIEYNVNIKTLELKTTNYKGYDTLGYKNILEHIGNEKMNLVVVDGPFGSPHYSRYQIIEMVPRCLAPSFCIAIDDYNRQGEKETFDEVCAILKSSNVEHVTRIYSSMKEHALICSKDLSFLTSL